MTEIRFVAVIDVGKTNAKLALVDLETYDELEVYTRSNKVLKSHPWPHFDIDGHWQFFVQGLKLFQKKYGIDGISVTTHGACAVLLDGNGQLAAPVLDYEFGGIEDTRAAYAKLRPDFGLTGSPLLANGLNIGAQLHWLAQKSPETLRAAKYIITYPQYWGFRLTGELSCDLTSLGCHTDLWMPHDRQFSPLLDTLNIREKMPPARLPGDVLGIVTPELSSEIGLKSGVPVACGIHDSNASLLPYLGEKKKQYSVVSTGTWVIAMTINGGKVKLDPAKETFVNVDANGNPVPSARFMGGREYELGRGKTTGRFTSEDVDKTLNDGIMLLPSLEPGAGPFIGHRARWRPNEPAINAPHRHVALSFYLALMTSICLRTISHSGDIVLEGPFGQNKLFLEMLASSTNSPLLVSRSQTGTSIGASMLFQTAVDRKKPILSKYTPEANPHAMARYSQRWYQLVGA
jgi:sugar (pentulose or hexulose) kinase